MLPEDSKWAALSHVVHTLAEVQMEQPEMVQAVQLPALLYMPAEQMQLPEDKVRGVRQLVHVVADVQLWQAVVRADEQDRQTPELA